MASLTEAYTQLLVAQVDPMNGVVKSLAQTQVASSELQLDEQRITTMQRLEKLIESASNANVKDAYQRMLDKYTK